MNPRPARLLLVVSVALALSAGAFTDAEYAAALGSARATGATACRAPAWARGTYVYRVNTPDAYCLGAYLAGLRLAAAMLDGDVRQLTLTNGLIGHDHPGGWNWDGLWPFWDRPTFRAGDWDRLSAFIRAAEREANAKISYHVNLTDVNTGLADYPESLAFFRRLVETKSIYRRDWDKAANKRAGTPYVMTEEQLLAERRDAKGDPIRICSLVNYGNFWDSGLAKEMIDSFYSHLPYAPPLLYLDVLTLTGGNFSTGYPDGPLGGSRETQLAGVTNICAYLRSRGTEVATEGDRREFGDYGTYGWLHCRPGVSHDDYSKILGAGKGPRIVLQHVLGCTGSFCLSPVALTDGELAADRAHWTALLAGRVSDRPMPTDRTLHVSDRGQADDRYNQIPGRRGGDPFRGSWVDAVNDFYLVTIQELYHIGRGSWRTQVQDSIGTLHLRALDVVEPSGEVTSCSVADGLEASAARRAAVRKAGRLMLEGPLRWQVTCASAGPRRLRLEGYALPQRGAFNVYLNGRLVRTETGFRFANPTNAGRPASFDLPGTCDFRAGANELVIDAGPVAAAWSDGTRALWRTPALGRGFEVRRGDVVFARDYDRMWPDSWSGRRKIHFFSWHGCRDAWTLPEDWAGVTSARLYPLTPDGRGAPVALAVANRRIAPELLPQVPYVLEPANPNP